MDDLTHGLHSPETGTGGCTRPDNRVFRRSPPKNDQRKFVPTNEGAFSDRTEASSYWLGFFLTDGCLYLPAYAPDRASTPQIHLGLQSTDASHVEKFAEFLGVKGKVRTRPPSVFTRGDGVAVRSSGAAYFYIVSERLASDLAALGIMPRKSLREIAPFPHVYDRHFWRGAVDGDGSLGWDRRGPPLPMIELVGSHSLIAQFHVFLDQFKCINTSSPHRFNQQNPDLWRLRFSGRPAARVVTLLYNGAGVYLDRKMSIATAIMRWAPKRRFKRSE